MIDLHAAENNAFTTVAVAIDSLDTILVMNDSVLDAVETPFYVDGGSELIEVTNVATSTPIAGQSTWTVARAVEGTAQDYAVDAPFVQRVYAHNTNEIQTVLKDIAFLFSMLTGGGDGVITPADESSLEVVPDSPASMDVVISVGAAMISSTFAVLRTAGSATLTAPVSGSRTDLIQISKKGVISVKTGSTSPDTDNIGLAEIAMTDATTEITVSEITDARTFI